MARTMKDSGLLWLGEIPSDWEVRKVKHYYKIQTGFTPDTKKQEFYDDDGYDWVNISDITDGATIFETKKKISQLYVDCFSPTLIPAGSLMYSFKLSVGQTAFSGKPLYTNEAIASFLDDEHVDLHYLRYSSSFIIENAQTNIYNAKILNQELINNAYIPFPPLSEQRRIASFLDCKCAEIDRIKAETETTIEEYKALKQSIITEAVTKGVRGERPMKDSGIEWVPAIPVDWDTIPSKFLFRNNDERKHEDDVLLTASQRHGIISQTEYMERENAKIVLANKGIDDWKHVEPYDFIISLRSFQGGLEMSETTGCITWHYIVLKPCKQIYSFYYKWLFKSEVYIKALQRTCNFIRDGQDLRYSNFIQVPLFQPSLTEQEEIAEYLNRKCAEIDELIEKKMQLFDELAVYKKSIIYEYVTGKKEVPC